MERVTSLRASLFSTMISVASCSKQNLTPRLVARSYMAFTILNMPSPSTGYQVPPLISAKFIKLYKAGVCSGSAPKNNTGNSINSTNLGSLKYLATCDFMELNTSSLNRPFAKSQSRNSTIDCPGLNTSFSIPTLYL